jgi:hypothetical protein
MWGGGDGKKGELREVKERMDLVKGILKKMR